MSTEELRFQDAPALTELVRRRQISPRELLQTFAAAIERLNPVLNAFVALALDRAEQEASELERRLAAGEDPGPLAGLPLGVKDLENVAGLPTTFGSRAFRENVAAFDDVHVARLRAAGAIVVGKTNTPEFGHLPYTTNDLFGATRNPWDPERTPGGSSGGSAAALASGMVPLVTASDGGGSIRIPACYTGLFGLKPTFGLVPIAPRTPLPWLDISCYGPLTRSVRDAALFLDVVAGPHPLDPTSIPRPVPSYVAAVAVRPARLRIACSRTLGVTRLQREVERAFDEAVRTLAELGHEVEEIPDTIAETGGWWPRMTGFQALASLWDVYVARGDEFTDRYRATLDAAHDVAAVDFREFYTLRAQLVEWTAGLFERYDLLATPTLPTEPFAAEGPIPTELDGQPFNAIAFTYPFNFTGHPAVSLPAGWTDGGLPCGLQLVAPRFREDLLLQVSREFEEARPWAHRLPPVR